MRYHSFPAEANAFTLISGYQILVLLCCLLPLSTAEAICTRPDAKALLEAMKARYAGVQDYRTTVEVKEFGGRGSVRARKRFLYTFKKPDHIRIDSVSSHKGMVVIYPDDRGKVAVFPAGLLSFLRLHLSPDNPLLEVSAGQRIDQTDMGLLIRNIAHSLTDQRRGAAEIKEADGTIEISVLAEDHFLKGIVTRYRFFIDEGLCLPTRIEESTPDGVPRRTIIFRDLRVNRGIDDTVFKGREGRDDNNRIIQ
jgi:outer membrane lipoprotein-sorting protein